MRRRRRRHDAPRDGPDVTAAPMGSRPTGRDSERPPLARAALRAVLTTILGENSAEMRGVAFGSALASLLVTGSIQGCIRRHRKGHPMHDDEDGAGALREAIGLVRDYILRHTGVQFVDCGPDEQPPPLTREMMEAANIEGALFATGADRGPHADSPGFARGAAAADPRFHARSDRVRLSPRRRHITYGGPPRAPAIAVTADQPFDMLAHKRNVGLLRTRFDYWVAMSTPLWAVAVERAQRRVISSIAGDEFKGTVAAIFIIAAERSCYFHVLKSRCADQDRGSVDSAALSPALTVFQYPTYYYYFFFYAQDHDYYYYDC